MSITKFFVLINMFLGVAYKGCDPMNTKPTDYKAGLINKTAGAYYQGLACITGKRKLLAPKATASITVIDAVSSGASSFLLQTVSAEGM